MRDRRTLNVVIEGVTEAQEIALNDLFATWQQLGSWGSSRDTTFFADGDGDFRPKITVNGEKAKFTDLLPRDQMWKEGGHGAYRIDFDWIGWKLSAIEEAANSCTKENPDRTKKHHDFPRDRGADTLCGNGCGLLWRETPYYFPPTDWKTTPHVAAGADGGTACTLCGMAYSPMHVEVTEFGPPETEQGDYNG